MSGRGIKLNLCLYIVLTFLALYIERYVLFRLVLQLGFYVYTSGQQITVISHLHGLDTFHLVNNYLFLVDASDFTCGYINISLLYTERWKCRVSSVFFRFKYTTFSVFFYLIFSYFNFKVKLPTSRSNGESIIGSNRPVFYFLSICVTPRQYPVSRAHGEK